MQAAQGKITLDEGIKVMLHVQIVNCNSGNASHITIKAYLSSSLVGLGASEGVMIFTGESTIGTCGGG